MTRQAENIGAGFDPEGSIFLPKTSNPEREFDHWRFELLLGRGIGEGKTYEQLVKLDEQVQEARSRYMGAKALLTE